MRDIEILAPAGSIESLYGALKLGADAVYVGANRFGARAFADNPTIEELEKALTYAHLRGKKIYLTVNTLLTDRELEEDLFPLIRPLYEAGLDACIVQDMGVLSFLHDNFSDMELHASTQMTLFSGEEANFLKPYGVTRYVPARELTIEEIREARKQTDLEIEVFVHGALCYCYSGQCLMSQVIGGRSGNRGMCAQPCRFSYHTEYGDGYFLSTKDSCTLMHIPELVEAGIDSFKIEGRMKRMEYSAYISHLYRKYTDIYLEKGKDAFQEMKENKESELWRDFKRSQDLYNRGGFSNSFLFEKDKSDIVFTEKNGHYGTPVGTVVTCNKRTAQFQVLEELHYQDVLEFRNEDGSQAYEYTVKDPEKKGAVVQTNIMPGSHIYSGQTIYRTKNTWLLEKVQKMVEETGDKYPLTGHFSGEKGKPSIFTVTGNGIRVSVEGALVENASNRPVTEDDIRKPLSKLGNTDYEWKELEVHIEEDAFLPLGGLKELRRQGIAKWEKQAVLKRTAKSEQINKEFEEDVKEPLKVISVTNFSQLVAAVEVAQTDVLFHLKLEDMEPSEWKKAVDLLENKRLAISFPRVLRGKGKKAFEKIWEEYGSVFSEDCVEAVVVNSHAMYLYAKKYWQSAVMYADTNLYQENKRATMTYKEFGILPSPQRVYGRVPVMVTESCVARTQGYCGKGKRQISLKTPKGDTFVVVNHCQYCYNTIYDNEPVQVKSEQRWKRLDFSWESEKEVRKVIREWNF